MPRGDQLSRQWRPALEDRLARVIGVGQHRGIDVFGQGHHIQHWAQGGPTTLSNLAILCRRHHRAVHEEGFQVERRADGELAFRHPHGWAIPHAPPPARVPADPEESIRAQNEAQGLPLDAHTATPGWLGERLDLGYAMDVLHPRARNN